MYTFPDFIFLWIRSQLECSLFHFSSRSSSYQPLHPPQSLEFHTRLGFKNMDSFLKLQISNLVNNWQVSSLCCLLFELQYSRSIENVKRDEDRFWHDRLSNIWREMWNRAIILQKYLHITSSTHHLSFITNPSNQQSAISIRNQNHPSIKYHPSKAKVIHSI